MATTDDQQFCLRWNNFQANFTSQFETLRDDEDFTDVTIACEGQKLHAHKLVLSACSPFFKDLFKTNPCSHPIIFMKDVEAQHIVALMEFMYAGEVNVAQANLSSFLKTAESLKIRGLTDTSSELDLPKECTSQNTKPTKTKQNKNISIWSAVTSTQDVSKECSPCNTPPPKKQCTDLEFLKFKQVKEEPTVNSVTREESDQEQIELKMERPDYLSEEEEVIDATEMDGQYFSNSNMATLPGDTEIIHKRNHLNFKEMAPESSLHNTDSRKLHSLDPRPCEECGRVYSNLSNLRQHMKLIHYPTYVKCEICYKSFKTDLYLRRHMIGSHNNMTQRSYVDSKSALSISRVQPKVERYSQ